MQGISHCSILRWCRQARRALIRLMCVPQALPASLALLSSAMLGAKCSLPVA